MAALRGKDAINKLTGVAPAVFSPEIRAQMELPSKVVINDITLREGRQAEGTILTPEECVKIAELLVHDLNVPMLQIGGYVERDKPYMKAVSQFLKTCGRKVRTESMSSAHQNFPKHNRQQLLDTIDQIGEAGFGAVICLATSDDMLRGCAEYRNEGDRSMDYLRQQEIETGLIAIAHARKRGIEEVNINLQDFLRADLDYLKQFCKSMADAGANTLYGDDFGGGIALPILYKEVFKAMKRVVPNTPLGIHAHNNAGLATASALASVEGGVEVVDVGINGYGEGPGHVTFADTVYHLEYLYGFDTGIKLENLRRVSVLIADIMRQPLPKTTPLIGDSAFVFMHDKHHQFPRYPFLYEPMKPAIFGNRARPGFAEWPGPFGLRLTAKSLGVTIPDDKVRPMLSALQEEMRWRKRALSDHEFIDLAGTVCNNNLAA
jgi:isopropylmalate/homocitrate/citramalate synthase